jgi:hypothetical protein
VSADVEDGLGVHGVDQLELFDAPYKRVVSFDDSRGFLDCTCPSQVGLSTVRALTYCQRTQNRRSPEGPAPALARTEGRETTSSPCSRYARFSRAAASLTLCKW